MPLTRSRSKPERVRAAIAVAALHALLAYAFIVGLGVEVTRAPTGELKLITITEKKPPPPEKDPPERPKEDKAEGAASPVSMAARPTPVVAPPPRIRLPKPPPIPTVPKASPVPPGPDRSAGVADRPGPGTGTGGEGAGMGSGGSGTGTGGGGVTKPVRIRGRLDNDDYPSSARNEKVGGSVAVIFTVEASGRVSGCRVARSSGRPDLDATTCRLIEERFVYKPATNGDGKPIQSVLATVYNYQWLRGRASRD